jgi:hypothetical protein
MLKRVDDGSWTFPGGCIDELPAVTAAIRRTIEDDRFPHAPRLDPLKAALGKFEAAPEPSAPSKAPPPAKNKRARRAPFETRSP